MGVRKPVKPPEPVLEPAQAVEITAEVTPQQERLIAALLTTATISAAAASCNIGETTAYRWLSEPVFKAAYRAARLQMLSAATGALRQATGAAVDALVRNLDCGKPGIEIQAAKVLLDMAYRSAEQGEMQERMDELEALVTRSQEGEN